MRKFRNLSVRSVEDLLGVSFTTVSHMENGRAEIHEEYLNSFLSALEFNTEDWECFVKGKFKENSLRQKCIELIETIEPSKLEKLFVILNLLCACLIFNKQ